MKRHGRFLGRDPKQSLKGRHGGLTPIVPKDVLVQVALEMLWFYAMMRPVEPSFQIPKSSVNMRETLVRALCPTDDADVVHEVRESRLRVSRPSIRANSTSGITIPLQKASETLFAGIGNQSKPQSTSAFFAFPVALYAKTSTAPTPKLL